MNPIGKILSAALIFTAVSCSGTFPGVGILAPASPANHTMSYADLDASHHLRFSPDGTYRAEIVGHDGGKRQTSGTWDWERRGASEAVLTLDGTRKLSLDFTTASHASLKLDGDKRPYSADFTKKGN